MSTHLHPGLVEHAKLDHAFRDVFDAFKRGEPDRAAWLFSNVAQSLRTHLEREELDLDAFGMVDPAEAAALRDDHASLRTALGWLETAAASGMLVADDVFAFKAKFSVHEAREERGLYAFFAKSMTIEPGARST